MTDCPMRCARGFSRSTVRSARWKPLPCSSTRILPTPTCAAGRSAATAPGSPTGPHIKTHRTAAWALRQIELGAKGITVQTVGEAEVMADAGINDLFLTTNTLGAAKLARLGAVAKRTQPVGRRRQPGSRRRASPARAGGRRDDHACWSNATPAAAAAVSPIPQAIAELAKYIAGRDGLALWRADDLSRRRQAAAGRTGLLRRPSPPAARRGSRCRSSPPAAAPTCGRTRAWRRSPNTAPAHTSTTTARCSRAVRPRLDQCAMTVLATVVSRPTRGSRHHRRRLQGADLRPARSRRLWAGPGASGGGHLPAQRGARADRRLALRHDRRRLATAFTFCPTTPASSPTCSTACSSSATDS